MTLQNANREPPTRSRAGERLPDPSARGSRESGPRSLDAAVLDGSNGKAIEDLNSARVRRRETVGGTRGIRATGHEHGPGPRGIPPPALSPVFPLLAYAGRFPLLGGSDCDRAPDVPILGVAANDALFRGAAIRPSRTRTEICVVTEQDQWHANHLVQNRQLVARGVRGHPLAGTRRHVALALRARRRARPGQPQATGKPYANQESQSRPRPETR